MFGNGTVGYRIMRLLRPPRSSEPVSTVAYGLPYGVTLRNLLGPNWKQALQRRTVIDFGCGNGRGSVEMAQHGAGRVIGVDIRGDKLEMSKCLAQQAGVSNRCEFVKAANAAADIVVSIDAFEHFDDPAAILRLMRGMIRPGGKLVMSFGPTWYHPYGGHFFSIFPWSHLIFSERAQIRWRAEFKNDGATRFTEVQGGLNLMTIALFEQLVAESGLVVASLRMVPIKRLRWLHRRVTREVTTAIVECLLVERGNNRSDRQYEIDKAARRWLFRRLDAGQPYRCAYKDRASSGRSDNRVHPSTVLWRKPRFAGIAWLRYFVRAGSDLLRSDRRWYGAGMQRQGERALPRPRQPP